MGIIQKINDYFSREKQIFIPKEETPEPIKPVIKEVEGNYGNRIEECAFVSCGRPIETFQKRKTFQGKKYHRECYRALYRLCREEAGI